jgi:hypothetical protein
VALGAREGNDMIKKIITYYCGVCDKAFESEETAQMCENNHAHLYSVISSEYEWGREFPTLVRVAANNGTDGFYRLVALVGKPGQEDGWLYENPSTTGGSHYVIKG